MDEVVDLHHDLRSVLAVRDAEPLRRAVEDLEGGVAPLDEDVGHIGNEQFGFKIVTLFKLSHEENASNPMFCKLAGKVTLAKL